MKCDTLIQTLSMQPHECGWIFYMPLFLYFSVFLHILREVFHVLGQGVFLPPGCVFVQMTLFLCQTDMEFNVDFKNVVCMVYIHSLGRYLKFYASNFPVKRFKLHFCKKALKAVFSTNQKAAFL